MTNDKSFPESWWEGPGASLLRELDEEPSAVALEEQILARCQVPLRRRRNLRRVRGVGLGAILFLVGLLLGRQGLPSPPVSDGNGGGAQAEAPAEPSAPRDAPPSTDLSDPSQVEMLAEVSPEAASAEDLRRAGDQYLNERHDVSGAMRCYRKYLERLPEPERAAWEDGDTWLLASLRRAL